MITAAASTGCSTSGRCTAAAPKWRSAAPRCRAPAPRSSSLPAPRRAAAAATGGAPAPEFGDFYGSEVVQAEAASVMKQYEALMNMMGGFAAFDAAGKAAFADELERLADRLAVFNARAKMSDDPAVKEFLATMNRQLVFISTNLDVLYDNLREQARELRRIAEAEAAIVDAGQLVAFRAALRAQAGAGSAVQDALARNLNMEALMASPEVARTMTTHPRAMEALKSVIDSGVGAAEAWRGDPELHAMLLKVFEISGL